MLMGGPNKQNMYNLSLNDKKKAHTSHRLSRVDVQAQQKPPWAKVHRPIRSMTRQAGTGNQANAQNLTLQFLSWLKPKKLTGHEIKQFSN